MASALTGTRQARTPGAAIDRMLNAVINLRDSIAAKDAGNTTVLDKLPPLSYHLHAA
jgi:hypothetical protein